MDIFRIIAERKIDEAMEAGEFDYLPGRGKPLILEDDRWIPEDLRAAYRILKNAGHIPPELELRKEIQTLKDLIMRIDDDEVRLKKVRELNLKIMNVERLRNRPLNLSANRDYELKIAERVLSS